MYARIAIITTDAIRITQVSASRLHFRIWVASPSAVFGKAPAPALAAPHAMKTDSEVVFDFRNCRAEVAKKTLLRDVSASVSSGHVLAIMGPSGAGKSTLLDLLSGKTAAPGVKRTATITLNGHLFSDDLWYEHCAVVSQQDQLWTFLTCREHLELAFKMFHANLSNDELEAAVTQRLIELGLASCENVRAGTSVVHEKVTVGLSGGQRRRVSFGIALTKQPAVLITDEPTSGLDAAATAGVMALLSEISRSARVATVCTIHQPSAAVYAKIDEVLLLSRGATAYLGPADGLAEYMSSLGQPVPPGSSLTEHALILINSDFTSTEAVESLLDTWRSGRGGRKLPPVVQAPLPVVMPKAGIFRQTWVLLGRQGTLVMKDPSMMMMRLTASIINFSIVCVFFFDIIRRGDQVAAFKITQFDFQIMCFFLLYMMITVRSTSISRVRLKFDLINGMYTSFAYNVSVIFWSIIANFGIILTCLLVTYGWASVIPWSSFLLAVGILFTIATFFELFAMACGYGLGVVQGTALYVNCMLLAIVLNGYYVPPKFQMFPLNYVVYANPMYYALYSFFRVTMINMEFTGAQPCEIGPHCPRGFFCPNEAPTGCYGFTGAQVLDSMSAQYGAIGSDDRYWMNFMLVIATSVGMALVLMFIVYRISATLRDQPMPAVVHGVLDAVDEAPTVVPLASGQPDKIEATSSSQESSDAIEDFARLLESAQGTAEQNDEVQLVVSNLSLRLRSESDNKHLLRNVNFTVGSGQVSAIMGPSGAGKTTLLDLLLCDSKFALSSGSRAMCSGSVTINGHPLTMNVRRNYVAYIEQHDYLWAHLTCYEHIRVMASLLHGRTLGDSQCGIATEQILKATGLASCVAVRACMLSGGQRRRLSVAIAILRRPALLVLDEPTTGLDDAAARQIMRLVGVLSRALHAAAVCTIHQPSAAVYAELDQVLLLSRGAPVYCGPGNELAAYLGSLGKPVPQSVNLAEHALLLLNPDYTSVDDVEALIDRWRARQPTPGGHVVAPLPPLARPASSFQQASLILWRHFRLFVRDGQWVWSRLVSAIIISVMYTLGLVSARKRIQQSSTATVISIILIVQGASSLAIMTMSAYSFQWPYLLKEMKMRLYKGTAYCLAILPLQCVAAMLTSLALILPGFIITDWTWHAAGFMWITMTAFVLTLDFIMEFFAFDDVSQAQVGWGFLSLIFTLSGGFFMSADQMLPVLNLFYYVSPVRYVSQNSINLIFLMDDREMTGSHFADNSTVPGRSALARGAKYWCDDWATDPQGIACYGPTLRDAAIGIKPRFDLIEVDLPIWEPLVCLLAIAMFFKICTAVRLYFNLKGDGHRGEVPPERPSSTGTKTEGTPLLGDETPKGSYLYRNM